MMPTVNTIRLICGLIFAYYREAFSRESATRRNFLHRILQFWRLNWFRERYVSPVKVIFGRKGQLSTRHCTWEACDNDSYLTDHLDRYQPFCQPNTKLPSVFHDTPCLREKTTYKIDMYYGIIIYSQLCTQEPWQPSPFTSLCFLKTFLPEMLEIQGKIYLDFKQGRC